MDEGNRLRFAALRSLGGLLRQAAVLRHRIQVVVFVRVGALFERGVGRHEEPGEVPRRGADPAREPLVGEGVTGPGTDEVEVEGFDEAVADGFGGLGGVGHGCVSLGGLWHGGRR